MYGIKEYKELLEKNLKDLQDPMSSPFGSDPYSSHQTEIRIAKMESINYALEMLPDHNDMKDHQFRDHVNDLLNLVKTYGHTQQLRLHLRSFLYHFKDQC